MLGRANKVAIDKQNTTIAGGAGTKDAIDTRIAAIKLRSSELSRTTTARSCRNDWQA